VRVEQVAYPPKRKHMATKVMSTWEIILRGRDGRPERPVEITGSSMYVSNRGELVITTGRQVNYSPEVLATFAAGVWLRAKKREEPHTRAEELIRVAVDYAGIHIGDCPLDDTCDCPGKEYNDLIQKTIEAAQRLEPLE